MKILTLLGSPKKNGNTAAVLNLLENELTANGHEFEKINVIDYKVNGCTGCVVCIKEKSKPNCIQEDDAKIIFHKIMLADLIIYATPVYAHSFPAQMKTLIDRHYCFVTDAGAPNQSSVVAGKKVSLLLTNCYKEETTDLIQESFDRIFTELKCNIVGKFVVSESSFPDFLERAEKIVNVMQESIGEGNR
jgi:multimeric flavodoxin WrbA